MDKTKISQVIFCIILLITGGFVGYNIGSYYEEELMEYQISKMIYFLKTGELQISGYKVVPINESEKTQIDEHNTKPVTLIGVINSSKVLEIAIKDDDGLPMYWIDNRTGFVWIMLDNNHQEPYIVTDMENLPESTHEYIETFEQRET